MNFKLSVLIVTLVASVVTLVVTPFAPVVLVYALLAVLLTLMEASHEGPRLNLLQRELAIREQELAVRRLEAQVQLVEIPAWVDARDPRAVAEFRAAQREVLLLEAQGAQP